MLPNTGLWSWTELDVPLTKLWSPTFLGGNYQPDVWLSAFLHHITVFILVPVCYFSIPVTCTVISHWKPLLDWTAQLQHKKTTLKGNMEELVLPALEGWLGVWTEEERRFCAWFPPPEWPFTQRRQTDCSAIQHLSTPTSTFTGWRGGYPKLRPSERATSWRKQNRVRNSGRQPQALQTV